MECAKLKLLNRNPVHPLCIAFVSQTANKTAQEALVIERRRNHHRLDSLALVCGVVDLYREASTVHRGGDPCRESKEAVMWTIVHDRKTSEKVDGLSF